MRTRDVNIEQCSVRVSIGAAALDGDLCLPEKARGLVLFAHGSGSSRFSPRNRYVAQELRNAGLGTFLFDLLTEREEAEDAETGKWRFDINFLADRLVKVTDWVLRDFGGAKLSIGYFGASTGAAAALMAAAARPDVIKAVVSRGGRPDLAMAGLPLVKAPTLLIVGGRDYQVINLNRTAFERLAAERELVIVPGATHLFEEPGALEEVAKLASKWFASHLAAPQV